MYFNVTPPMPDVYLFNPIPMTHVAVPKSFGDSTTVFILEGRLPEESPEADILFLKHNSSIFRQSSNPVCGSWKRQARFQLAKQHRA